MAKIRRLTKYIGMLNENDQPVNEFKQLVQEYDQQQNCIKEVEFNSRGEVENASGYKFNDQNKKIEEIHYFNEDEIGEQIQFKLDEEGKTIEIETTYADDAKSIKKIKRSEHLIEARIYDEEGDLEGEEIVKLNSNARPIEEIQYDEDKNVVRRFIYEYDKDENIIARTEYGEDNIFLVKITFEYDNHGHLIRLIQLNEKGRPVGSTLYQHDDKGNQILMQTDRHIQRSAYDEKGNLVSMEIINRVNNLVESFNEYKYGDHGLVIEERTFEMGDAHQLEPGVFSRSGSNLQLTRYEYEFFED
jgi:uncharacterized protein YuzE